MTEFAFSHGRMSKGIWSALWASLKFVIIPLALIMMLDFALMEVASGLGDVDPGLEAISKDLDTIMVRAIILGIPLVALAYFKGFYPRGSTSRLTFGLALVAGTMLWLWWITFGGRLDVVLADVGISLDTSALLGLFLLAIGLGALIFLAEWKDYRQDFLHPPEEGDMIDVVPATETEVPPTTATEELVADDEDANNDSEPGATDI